MYDGCKKQRRADDNRAFCFTATPRFFLQWHINIKKKKNKQRGNEEIGDALLLSVNWGYARLGRLKQLSLVTARGLSETVNREEEFFIIKTQHVDAPDKAERPLLERSCDGGHHLKRNTRRKKGGGGLVERSFNYRTSSSSYC